MMFYMSRNEDMEMELASGILDRHRYGDKELRGVVIQMCREMFQSDSPESLCVEDRYRLADALRRNMGSVSVSWRVLRWPTGRFWRQFCSRDIRAIH